MKQIFDRFKKYVKSEVNSSKFDNIHSTYVEDDEELKRIIDELENTQFSDEKSSFSGNENASYSKNITLNDAYLILGLSNNASQEEVKTAYKKMMNEYHPDKVASLGVELRDLAQKKSLEINKAYELIKQSGKF